MKKIILLFVLLFAIFSNTSCSAPELDKEKTIQQNEIPAFPAPEVDPTTVKPPTGG